jgi:hypothetical protein
MKAAKQKRARRFAVKAALQFSIAPHDACLDPVVRSKCDGMTCEQRQAVAAKFTRWARQLRMSAAGLQAANN